MKILVLLLAMATLGTVVRSNAATIGSKAAGAPETSGGLRGITVYLSNSIAVPALDRAQAQHLAAELFAGIGVMIRWKLRGSLAYRETPEPGGVVVEFGLDTPEMRHPGAYGYALPYEGVHIGIFQDRIGAEPDARELLAYVLVHEITHVLQGGDWHAAKGIMKARWNGRDRSLMQTGALRFTTEDVFLIHSGMDARAAQSATPGPVSAAGGARLKVAVR